MTAEIPAGYADVDPRTATRVPLWQELSPANPIFPGDPEFTVAAWTTIPESGYLVERLTSLGVHTGTHISVPGHFIDGGALLSELDESWTLMPLAVIDVRSGPIEAGTEDPNQMVDVAELRHWEQVHGRIPRGGCVLLLTGFAQRYAAHPADPDAIRLAGSDVVHPSDASAADPTDPTGPTAPTAPTDPGSYFAPAPGFTEAAAQWLFAERGIRVLGSDTFGPDATADESFGASTATMRNGGITVENVGPGLARMRPHGDWISINGGRPRFSGFQVGITGFTI